MKVSNTDWKWILKAFDRNGFYYGKSHPHKNRTLKKLMPKGLVQYGFNQVNEKRGLSLRGWIWDSFSAIMVGRELEILTKNKFTVLLTN